MNRPPIRGVYLVTCLETGEQYVGQSVNIAKRWARHRALLNANRHERVMWQTAWNTYGPDAFTWDVLEEVPAGRDLTARESHYISGLKPAFNGGATQYDTTPGDYIIFHPKKRKG